ncbi:MAG: PIG-L family deacetylase [Bryobacteraceae bacterium]|nr:PIG-L family deacetylase [Bryobacteraceae bacterium]
MFLILWLALASPVSAESILAVFAHPDDETTVGPLLARYAAEGHTVRLLTLTSGQIGTANTKLKAGDELGAAREEELRCACRGLGIGEPELGRFMDGGVNTGPALEKMAQKVRQMFEQAKPDVVITWGPDGLTGHPDHRAAGAVATQVFQRQGLLPHKARKLYYVAYPESLFANFQSDNQILKGLAAAISSRVVSDAFVTTVVDAGRYLDQAQAAIRCHKTQWPPQQMQAMADLNSKVLKGKVYLRLALSSKPLPRSLREKDILK